MQQESYFPVSKFGAPVGNGILKIPLQQTRTVEIVLAEDDIDEQYFFEVAIKELTIATKVKVVADGIRLLDYLLLNLPDIIFLDIMMPRKDGIECLKEIKRNERLKEIPIIMYSNSVGDDYIMRTYEYGALYFLQKGNYAELTASIEKLLTIINNTPQQATLETFKFSLRD